ncbi:hypothetical protein D3C72_1473930 [compost metagenome]
MNAFVDLPKAFRSARAATGDFAKIRVVGTIARQKSGGSSRRKPGMKTASSIFRRPAFEMKFAAAMPPMLHSAAVLAVDPLPGA